MRYLYVLAGGAAGSLLRYYIGLISVTLYSGNFPLGTFLVNLTGSFLIGCALSRLPAASALRPLLVSGFLGGFTTFSAFEWETVNAVRGGMPLLGLLNVLLSVGAGFGACWAGASLFRPQ